MSIYLSTPKAIHTSRSRALKQCRTWDNLDWLSRRTSVASALAAVGSLTGSRQRVPQGTNGCVLDPQRRTHQQQHRLPGALHPALLSGSTSFTLMLPGRHRDTHNEVSFWCIFQLHTCTALNLFMPETLFWWPMRSSCWSSQDSCSGALKQWRSKSFPFKDFFKKEVTWISIGALQHFGKYAFWLSS